jgi:sugar phosphate isomerase/epimerase
MKTILSVSLFMLLLSFVSCGGKKKQTPPPDNERYKVSVCDWMMIKRQKLGAIPLAKEVGADGLEIDMGSLGKRDSFDNKLRQPEVLEQFKQEAKKCGIAFSSVAMSGFYAQSLVGRANYLDLVKDCLQTMKALGVKVAFLPLGTQGDLVQHPEIRPEMVRRLREIGNLAAKDSLVVGIETSLDAHGEVALLNEVNSPGIKIYFNFETPLVAGRNLCGELRTLGKERICQIHCTDTDGVNLRDDKNINMSQVKQTLDDMGWSGWLVVERSRDASDVHNVRKNFSANVNYVKEVFQK